MEMSISFVTKTNMTSLKHNNRDLTEAEFSEPAHEHIQKDLVNENIYIKKGNLKDTYDELFGEALENYNAKQKRPDRLIEDYYQHVKKSKTLDLQREIVVSIGSKEDWDKLTFEDKKEVAHKLEEYILGFEQRHTNLHIYNAVVHVDEEGAPHAHFNIVPVAEGYKNGLEKQPSFKKALANEGYVQKGRGQLKEFRDKEVDMIAEKLKELNIDRKIVGTNDIKDMKEYKEFVFEIKKAEEKLAEIDSKASRKLSELEKHQRDINDLEREKRGLEEEIEAYKDGLVEFKNAKLKSEDWRNEFQGKVKKSPLTGKETVVLDKETYEKARWSFASQENRLRGKDKQIKELEDRWEVARGANHRTSKELDEIKDELKDLRIENKWLRTQNKGLKERLDLMTRKLNVWRKTAKEKLPKAEFKDLSKRLNKVQPLKEIIKPIKVLSKVKEVIEKSLF